MQSNIHETALIGSPAQWRGKKTIYPVEIDPSAVIGAYTCIDAGCERPTKIGANTHVMKQVHVGHGVWVGDNCDIATGTVLGGESTIGNGVRIGIGVLVLPFRTVGDGARLGSGAVVTRDIPARTVAVGNPARVVRGLTAKELKWLEEIANVPPYAS